MSPSYHKSSGEVDAVLLVVEVVLCRVRGPPEVVAAVPVCMCVCVYIYICMCDDPSTLFRLLQLSLRTSKLACGRALDGATKLCCAPANHAC